MRTITFDEALASCPSVTKEMLEHWKTELELEGLSCPAIDRRIRVINGGFSEEDVAAVKSAIRRAKKDIAEYARQSSPDPLKMITPLTPPPRR